MIPLSAPDRESRGQRVAFFAKTKKVTGRAALKRNLEGRQLQGARGC
jgi:hypothetical protein